jgi:hypothetical protein
MFSNNEIKKNCCNNKQDSTQVNNEVKVEVKEKTKPIYKINKLISSYEEDYTRNNKEINQLLQRN